MGLAQGNGAAPPGFLAVSTLMIDVYNLQALGLLLQLYVSVVWGCLLSRCYSLC